MKLAVLLPIYSEERDLAACLDRVLVSPIASEVVAVDDASTDSSSHILARCHDPRLKIIRHERNRGKGCAIQTPLLHVHGDLCIIKDADTEYDPNNYVRLVAPIVQGRAQIVYGTRDLRSQPLIGYLGNSPSHYSQQVDMNAGECPGLCAQAPLRFAREHNIHAQIAFNLRLMLGGEIRLPAWMPIYQNPFIQIKHPRRSVKLT